MIRKLWCTDTMYR